MIGFLLFDSAIIEPEKAVKAIDALHTFTLLKQITILDTNLVLFRNQYKNNYYLENERYILCVTGTFIYKSQRGNNALKELSRNLKSNNHIEHLYSDFRGHYNLIYCNKKTSKISLLTDKEGVQQSFVFSRNSRYAFSSNLLLLAALVDTALDPCAIWEYVHINITMQWKTIFKDIKRSLPATLFNKVEDTWNESQLWKIRISYPYLKDTDRAIIKKTSSSFIDDLKVLSNMDSDEIIADLSGGTDTRTLLTFLLKYHDKITVSTAGPCDHIDVLIARRIAEKMGLDLYWYEDKNTLPRISQERMDEIIEIADGTINPFLLLKSLPYIQEKAKQYNMILGGNGGPLFKDHFWLFEFNRINRMSEPKWKRIAQFSLTDYPIQDELFQKPYIDIHLHFENMFLDHSKQIQGTNNQKIDYVYFTLKCPMFMGPQLSLTNKFQDVYHPMLNADIVEYMMNIRPDIRKRNILQFSMIYKNNPKLAWIRTDNACPAVPSTGKYVFLRIYVFWRYLKAFLRKYYMIVLKRNYIRQVHSLKNMEEQLKELGYMELLNYSNMKIAPMLSEKEIRRILDLPHTSSNFTYILNILSVELFIKKVEMMGNKKISF